MFSQIMIQEMVDAIEREREVPGASRNGWSRRSYTSDKRGLVAGAQYWVGGALVRVGRSLQRGAAPRPELAGSPSI
jgi:hypothetical protein